MESCEQKYKIALERAKQELKACGSQDCDAARQIFRLFPELKESEDEKIREEIIHLVKKSNEYGGYALHKDEADRMLAWLEKQDEQKPTNKEPMFEVGDWILIDNPCQIESIDNNGNYIVQYCDAEETHLLSKNFCDSHFHLWTIQDAKEGDVLINGHGAIILVKESRNSSWGYRLSYHCAVLSDGVFESREFHVDPEKFFPATKEQRDLLFQKIEKAEYKWDAEKKELTKL